MAHPFGMNIDKGRRFDKEIIMTCVRWYLAYSLSCRDLEKMMEERGLKVAHSTINRWVVTYPQEFSTLTRNVSEANRCVRNLESTRSWVWTHSLVDSVSALRFILRDISGAPGVYGQ